MESSQLALSITSRLIHASENIITAMNNFDSTLLLTHKHPKENFYFASEIVKIDPYQEKKQKSKFSKIRFFFSPRHGSTVTASEEKNNLLLFNEDDWRNCHTKYDFSKCVNFRFIYIDKFCHYQKYNCFQYFHLCASNMG